MSKNNKPVLINRLHLIYLLIIAAVIILSVLAINHWSGNNASVALSNWATASSIVLAVVAIVMTIVDVAGQRNNILDLKETSEMLKNNLNKIEEQVVEIDGIRETLLNSMGQVFESNEKLRSDFKQFLEKVKTEDLSEEEKEKLTNDYIKKLNKDKLIDFWPISNESIVQSHFLHQHRVRDIKKIIMDLDAETYSQDILMNLYKSRLPYFTEKSFKDAVKELKKEGKIDIDDKDRIVMK